MFSSEFGIPSHFPDSGIPFLSPLSLFTVHSEDRTVQCPLCRVQSPVSHQPGGGLKPNHYLANIVEKLKTAKKSKLCGMCVLHAELYLCTLPISIPLSSCVFPLPNLSC